MKSEVMYEGVDLDAGTARINRILHGNEPKPFIALPEVPAAVQEAGDKAFAQSAYAAADPFKRIEATRKKRADAGKPRPKPQPAPEPEQKAGGITAEQAEELNRLIRAEFEAREAYADAEITLAQATGQREFFVKSLLS